LVGRSVNCIESCVTNSYLSFGLRQSPSTPCPHSPHCPLEEGHENSTHDRQMKVYFPIFNYTSARARFHVSSIILLPFRMAAKASSISPSVATAAGASSPAGRVLSGGLGAAALPPPPSSFGAASPSSFVELTLNAAQRPKTKTWKTIAAKCRLIASQPLGSTRPLWTGSSVKNCTQHRGRGKARQARGGGCGCGLPGRRSGEVR